MFIVGVDLGQSRDSTAIAIIERAEPAAPEARRVDGILIQQGEPLQPVYSLRHLERPALGTPYTLIVERVIALLDMPPLDRFSAPLVLDKTGVGAAICDLFTQAGVRPRALTITGGDRPNVADPYDLRVPKRDLASTLVMLFQTGRLRLARGLPLVQALVDELAAFQMKINPITGNDSYEAWRESDHDDLVLAVAMSCWWLEQFVARQAQEPAYSTGKDRHVRVEQRRGYRPLG